MGEPVVSFPAPGGGFISMPASAVMDGPHIQWNHVDGPVMHWGGEMWWLTIFERIDIFLNGWRAVERIAEKRFPLVHSLYEQMLAGGADER